VTATGQPFTAGRLPSRVLMTTDAVGGVWDYALELCAGLGACGVEVVLAVMGPAPRDEQIRAAGALGNVELAIGRYALEWQTDPWSDVEAAGRWLLELARDRRIELVHANGYAAGALPFGRPKIVVGHSCVLSWWRAVRGEDAPHDWDRYRQVVGEGLRRASAIVAPSRFMASELRGFYGAELAIEVIPNGRSPGRYRVADKQPIVLSAGRVWDEAKNVAALGRIARRLPWRVAIAGASTPAGESTAEAPGWAIDVDWLGRLSAEALAGCYAEASIYALPARYEPFGLTVLEAALSGCALVLGDVPSLRELWGGVAAFVPPNDDDAIADSIEALIRDVDRRHRMARDARRRAEAYSAEAMVSAYLALYRNTAAAPNLQEALCAS
jgi:glycosyltransferase involved in cell wall biosynthesis